MENKLLSRLIAGKYPSVDVPWTDADFRLRLRGEEATEWVNNQTAGQTPSAMLQNARAPQVAVWLEAIDFRDEKGFQPVDVLFPLPDDMSASSKEFLRNSDKDLTEWRHGQVLQFIKQLDFVLIEHLYLEGIKLQRQHREEVVRKIPLSQPKKTLTP